MHKTCLIEPICSNQDFRSLHSFVLGNTESNDETISKGGKVVY